MSIKPLKELVERHKIVQYIHLDLNYKYIENKSTTQNKSAEHSFFFLSFFLYRKNRLCLKIHTISSMFLFLFSLINYVSDNTEKRLICKWWGKEDGYSIHRAIRQGTQACNAESEQENSNLIMPFLVQNEKVIEGLATLRGLRKLLLVKHGPCDSDA